MFGIGPMEMIILLVVVLLVVGPAKAPSVARSLGRSVREVKSTVDDAQREVRDAVLGTDDDTKRVV
jgi:TatA/E family protein of Tat protein translocase